MDIKHENNEALQCVRYIRVVYGDSAVWHGSSHSNWCWELCASIIAMQCNSFLSFFLRFPCTETQSGLRHEMKRPKSESILHRNGSRVLQIDTQRWDGNRTEITTILSISVCAVLLLLHRTYHCSVVIVKYDYDDDVERCKQCSSIGFDEIDDDGAAACHTHVFKLLIAGCSSKINVFFSLSFAIVFGFNLFIFLPWNAVSQR